MTDVGDRCEAALQEICERGCERADVAAALANLARQLGLEGLELDEQGTAGITVDGEIDITLAHLPHLPGLVAAAVVAEAAGEDGALARRLLQANTSWALTQGGSFAMLPGRPELMLCRLVAVVGRDGAALDQELAAFVDLVRAWRDDIEEALEEPAAPEEGGPEVPEHFMRV
jgi:Tir chaperone protein (CesT) family